VTDFLISPVAALTRYFVAPEREGEDNTGTDQGVPLQRYGFRIGEYRFMHDLLSAVELSELPRFYELPNSKEWFRGLANLRGNLLPVFDLNLLLGSSEAYTQRQMLLVIGAGEQAAGLVIDGSPTNIRVDSGSRLEITKDVPEILQEHLKGIYEHEGETWYDADYEGIFQALALRGEDQH
jgi:twitching motility protein PilI